MASSPPTVPACVLRAHRLLGRGRPDRGEHLDLLVAHLVGLEGGRRLHAGQRDQLQHVVLHEVAQRARPVVVAGAGADADVLGARDLDVVDVVPVPDGLEHHVREPERHDVLDRLLAQVVVDAEDLALAEHAVDDLLELAGGVQVGAERLLDDAAHIRLLVAVQARGLDLLDDHREELRRRRQVVRAVERLPGLLVELVQDLRELGVAVRVVEVRRDVLHVPEQAAEHLVVRRPPRVLADRGAALLAEVVVPLLAAGDADQLEALGQRALVGEVVERGQELAVRQVARRAEDDERGRRDRQALEALDERVLLLLLGDGHRHALVARSTACPPNWLRRAASTRCV